MGKLTRENATTPNLKSEDVSITGWPDSKGEPSEAKIVQLTAGEIIDFLDLMENPEHKKDGMFWIVQKCLRDRDTNETILLEEDVETWRKNDFHVYKDLQKVALRLNGLDKLKLGGGPKKPLSEAATAASPTS